MRTLFLILTALWLTACGPRYARTVRVEKDDTPEQILAKAVSVVPTPQQLHALDNGFAAFVHFGPNTFTGVEWGSGVEDPAVFAPQGLDTDQWCSIFKDAGMKRVILTAKHHDGFVLWRSRYTTHGVVSSCFEGDVVKELAASCRKYGLEFGFYLSPADLYQMEAPDGLYGNGSAATLRTIPRPVEGRPFDNPASFQFEVDDYNEYFLNQLFELLTEYGPVSEVWFDGAHPKRKGGQQYNYLAWKELIHTLAPDAVVFGKEDLRWCGNEAGETRESEWNVIPYAQDPATMNMFDDLTDVDLGSQERLFAQEKPFWLHYHPAETDVSVRDGWFWRDDTDQAVRSADNVFDIWERAVGGNSILLLNVPPNRAGRISPRDSAVLEDVGRRILETYTTDLLTGARITHNRLNNDLSSTESDRRITAVEYELPLAIRFNRLELREDLAKGERVKAFALDVWEGGWREVARGTNIGYRRILRFPEQNALRLRVRILSSRAKPHISTIRAYLNEP